MTFQIGDKISVDYHGVNYIGWVVEKHGIMCSCELIDFPHDCNFLETTIKGDIFPENDLTLVKKRDVRRGDMIYTNGKWYNVLSCNINDYSNEIYVQNNGEFASIIPHLNKQQISKKEIKKGVSMVNLLTCDKFRKKVFLKKKHKKFNKQEVKILITQQDNKVYACLQSNGKVEKMSVAKCSPNDIFDFKIGAKLALDRLFNSEQKPKENYSWVKCIGYTQLNEHFFTVGKKYKIYDNGDIMADNGYVYEAYETRTKKETLDFLSKFYIFEEVE